MTGIWWLWLVETDNLVHISAREVFSRSGELYERARSDYPDSVAQKLFKHLNLKRGARVLELAAGTGKWTEQLIKAGCEVTAVEPSAEMRNILFKRAPAAALVDAVAEELPFPSEYYDFVFAATAFHWFDAYKTYGEISRVLKPGGGVGLVWTSRDPGMEPQWYSDLRTLIKPFEGGTPRYSHMEWRTPFDREIDFRMLQFERHDISRPRTTVEIVERLLSISYISALPDLLFFALKRELEDILASYILGGQVFKMPEEIHLYWTHKES